MNIVDNYRLTLKEEKYVPIMIGGMGVDISTPELALEAARLGGIIIFLMQCLYTFQIKDMEQKFYQS
ncbi:MAG: hypothetical protein R3A13_12005 [Bdellovibrionota bacterium]